MVTFHNGLLYSPNFEAIAYTLSDKVYKPTVFDGGKKIIPAGTFLSRGSITDGDEGKVYANYTDDNVFGILLKDADVTKGPRPVAVLRVGHVNLQKLHRKPSKAIEEALSQIRFYKNYQEYSRYIEENY